MAAQSNDTCQLREQGRCSQGKDCPQFASGHFKTICHYFTKHGKCGYGDRCRYSHDPRLWPCQDLLQHGECTKDDCPRSHYPKICKRFVSNRPCAVDPCNKTHRPIRSPAVVEVQDQLQNDKSWTAASLLIHRVFPAPADQRDGQEDRQSPITCILMIYQEAEEFHGLSLPAGKREYDFHFFKAPAYERTFLNEHSSKDCVVREFLEETAGLMSEDQVRGLLQDQPRCVLADTTRVYFVSPSREVLPDDVKTMDEHLKLQKERAKSGQIKLEIDVALSFHWVPIKELLDRRPAEVQVTTLAGERLQLMPYFAEDLYFFLSWQDAMVEVLTEEEQRELDPPPLRQRGWTEDVAAPEEKADAAEEQLAGQVSDIRLEEWTRMDCHLFKE